MNQKLFCAIFFALGLVSLTGQDVHFTQYELSPVLINPAHTGGFNGSFRLGGLYRDQGSGVAGFGNGYSTPHFFVDATFPWAFRKQDWMGIGINFYQDRSGAIGLGKGGYIATAAYHIGLNKTVNSSLSVGAQFGSVSFNVKNQNDAIFFTQLSSGSPSPDNSKLATKGSYQDISAGLIYNTDITETRHQLKIGISAGHINQPSYTIASGTGQTSANKLKMLLSAHTSFQYHLNEKLDIIPLIWFRNLEKASETSVQGMLSYLFNVEKSIRLNAGLGYRFGDALQFMVGVNYGKIKAQIGIDNTISDLSKGSGFGAFEIGLGYVGTVVKKPNPKPKVFCPRF
ncbi:MAG: PorP/SprF family type IX secretion system membrane protein [Bacteroidota bacterium]|nr:PorP/SprF family type IX secretion system membrane protein [Bacteroidota bacterium]